MDIRSNLCLLVGLLICSVAIAQSKYITRTGTLGFESSMASFEPVVAKNESVTAVLDTDNGRIAILALVRGFRFPNALMEEHFNENYAETDRFPKASFSGRLINFNLNDLQKLYIIEGELNFHGVTQSISNVVAKVKTGENSVYLSGAFMATVADFDIEVPKLVRKKISKDIEITFELLLKKP